MSNWISVKDKLPETGKPVLTFSILDRPHPAMPGYAIRYKYADTGYITTDKEWHVIFEEKAIAECGEKPTVTHWMPLPEPPEVSE